MADSLRCNSRTHPSISSVAVVLLAVVVIAPYNINVSATLAPHPSPAGIGSGQPAAPKHVIFATHSSHRALPLPCSTLLLLLQSCHKQASTLAAAAKSLGLDDRHSHTHLDASHETDPSDPKAATSFYTTNNRAFFRFFSPPFPFPLLLFLFQVLNSATI